MKNSLGSLLVRLPFLSARLLALGCGMLLLGCGLLLSACGKSSDEGGGSGGKDEDQVFDDPNPGLPEHAEAPFSWGELREGLPEQFSVDHLAVADAVVYASLTAYDAFEPGQEPATDGKASGIYRLDEEALHWSFVGPAARQSGTRGLFGATDGELYAFSRDNLWRLSDGSWTELAKPASQLDRIVVSAQAEDLRLYGLSDDFTVAHAYDIEDDAWTVHVDGAEAAAEFGLPGGSGASGTVTADGTLYASRKWAIRDSEGEDGAVFRFRDGAWEDVTLELRATNDKGMPVHLLNATGSGWGPFGSLLRAPDGRDLFATSEQGAYRFFAEEGRWEPVASIWYGARVVVAGGTLCIGKERLYRYFDSNERQLVGSYERIQFRELGDVVSPESEPTPDQLFVAAFSREEKWAGKEYTYSTIVASRVDPNRPSESLDLTLDAASYLAGEGSSESPTGVAWAEDGTHYVASNVLDVSGEDPVATSGRVDHFDGVTLLGSIDSAAPVHDLVVTPSGEVLVATGAGLVALSSDLEEELWNENWESGARRVDVAEDGKIVALSGKTIYLLSAAGEPAANFSLERNYLEDLAVSSEAGLVYVVGFDNQNNGNPVQVPYLVAHRWEDQEFEYKVWGYDPSTLDADMADSRLYRVIIGEDGALYVAGELAGGNTVFRWNGQDLQTNTLVSFDPYNTATNTKSEHKGYFARLDAKTGAVERGQLIIPRLSNGGGNTFRPRALAADAEGRVFIGGVSAATASGRNLNRINGRKVAEYSGGDPSLLVVSPDFGVRLRWTTFTETPAGGTIPALDVQNGRALLAAETPRGTLFTTEGGLPSQDPEDETLLDAWFASFSGF